MPELTRSMLVGIPKNGPTDPIEYYRRPLVGLLYLERINMGLRLLDGVKGGRFRHVLEVGYGAGAVLLALAPSCEQMSGIDLDAEPEPALRVLASRGAKAQLRQGSVYELPYDDAAFDLVVSFSVFEHLHEYPRGLAEVARVTEPGGHFLLGMPAVNKMMDWGFRAIGFKGIDDHHVTTPQDVARVFAKHGFRVIGKRFLGLQREGAALYYTWLLQKT
jgi:ubiquinone/menaquinone biosynthesis C-methylase UbiE